MQRLMAAGRPRHGVTELRGFIGDMVTRAGGLAAVAETGRE